MGSMVDVLFALSRVCALGVRTLSQSFVDCLVLSASMFLPAVDALLCIMRSFHLAYRLSVVLNASVCLLASDLRCEM